MEATQVLSQQQNEKNRESVILILGFLKNKDKPKASKNVEDLLNFMRIVILDKNKVCSKRGDDTPFKSLMSLKRIFLDGKTKIEEWETILLGFLNDTPREQGLPWTEEEKEVWRLVLFFVSEQVGCLSTTGKEYHFMLESQERRAQLSPLILQLGLKSFK
jgi:hypothetical protein